MHNKQKMSILLGKIQNQFLNLVLGKSEKELSISGHSASSLFSICKKAEPLPVEECTALLCYRDPLVKNLIWLLKYKGNKEAIKLAGEILYDQIQAEMLESALFDGALKALLVPIPISRGKIRARGWNHAELLAREVARLDGRSLLTLNTNILVKTKNTPRQTSLKKKERLANLRESFSVKNAKDVCGSVVILVDDVITTGATMNECRRVLLKARAKKVVGFALAH